MGYSIYIRDTNTPKNHQACLANTNKDPTGYLKYTSLAEYLIKAINFLRRLVTNSEFLKDDEALAEILGETFKKGCRRSQQRKYNSFVQETNIGIYCTERNGNSHFNLHWTNLMNCEEICKMIMRAALDGDI